MSITVAEEGNRRHGGMTLAEIHQCAFDIKTWFARLGGEPIRPIGATPTELERLEKWIGAPIPTTLKSLLREVNGGIYFYDKKLLSAQDLSEVFGNLESKKRWSPAYFPFCGDESSLLIINVDEENAVYEWDVDEGLGEKVNSSFNSYIEDYRNLLLGGHCEYIKDVGVVEKLAARRK